MGRLWVGFQGEKMWVDFGAGEKSNLVWTTPIGGGGSLRESMVETRFQEF